MSGFDATVSAPKSLSAWWAITGDNRLLEAHDAAVKAVVGTLERYGATTRIRSNGQLLHPDTNGLTIAAFRQTTSRLDDPQIHSRVVISAKVQVDSGRWYALDARLLKKHQRALGGIYQSVLRAELSEQFGVRFGEIVNGQAEVLGVPETLLDTFSKRSHEVADALADKLAVFDRREGREPSPFERAAMEREAAVDTRGRKTGMTVTDLRPRWQTEAKELGITPAGLNRDIRTAGREAEPAQHTTVADVLAALSERSSVWHRMDVLRTLTDTLRPHAGQTGQRWTDFLHRAADSILEHSINLDPSLDANARRRGSDGRSIWIRTHRRAPHKRSRPQGVLACDRADIPAVVQRRQLAAKTPTRPAVPHQRPRCRIPDWWEPLESRAVDSLHRVSDALGDIDIRKAGEAARLNDARQELSKAKAALAPYDLLLNRADKTLAETKDGVTAAQANVAEHRLIGRRPAQQQLDAAEQNLAASEATVDDAPTKRQPFLQAAFAAERRCEAIIGSADMRATMDRYDYLPEKQAAAVDLLDALDTWRDWANGQTISPSRASNAVHTLESLRQHPDSRAFNVLADAIRTHTPELIITRQQTLAIEENSLDLGIGW